MMSPQQPMLVYEHQSIDFRELKENVFRGLHLQHRGQGALLHASLLLDHQRL